MEIVLLQEIINSNPELFEIFKHCSYEILKCWEIKKYKEQEFVYHQGDISDILSVIVDGYVDVYVIGENGKKYSPRIMGKGNFIGEMEIFDQRPIICYVQALTDLTLLQIKRDDFVRLLELDRNLCLYMIKHAYHMFCDYSLKIHEDNLYTLKVRLCNYLLALSKQKTDDQNVYTINCNKELLSERFAVTQRSINRILQYLKEKKIIEIKRDQILIVDIEKLKEEEK